MLGAAGPGVIGPGAIKEVVAVFDGADALDDAVFALETAGFNRVAFSILPGGEAVAKKIGHRYEQVAELEDDPRVPRATFFSRMSRVEAIYLPAPGLATLGALMFAGAGGGYSIGLIATGIGGLIGIILGGGIYLRRKARIREQLARGGLPLWVSVRDASEEEKALEILRGRAARDVHACKISA